MRCHYDATEFRLESLIAHLEHRAAAFHYDTKLLAREVNQLQTKAIQTIIISVLDVEHFSLSGSGLFVEKAFAAESSKYR